LLQKLTAAADCRYLKHRLDFVWAEFKQSIVDKAIDQWLRACVMPVDSTFNNWLIEVTVCLLFLQGHFFVPTSNLKANIHIVPFQFVKISCFKFLRGSVATSLRWSWKILIVPCG